MKITKVTCFATKSDSKVKASGVVTIDDAVDLKYLLMQGPKELFVSWAGGKAYDKKDGGKGWDSPIYVTDKALNDEITKAVLAKHKSVGSARSGASASAEGTPDSSFASDDIPF